MVFLYIQYCRNNFVFIELAAKLSIIDSIKLQYTVLSYTVMVLFVKYSTAEITVLDSIKLGYTVLQKSFCLLQNFFFFLLFMVI